MASTVSLDYSGPERRAHRLYVTRNHEYHCRNEICVAVRDIRTGEFVRHHMAIGKKASASLRLGENGIESISMPNETHVGERLHFTSGPEDHHDVLTSPVQAIERPPKEAVYHYARD
jgi:hypothetical protein